MVDRGKIISRKDAETQRRLYPSHWVQRQGITVYAPTANRVHFDFFSLNCPRNP